MQNGKHAIARNLIDGFAFGSTEFHVIRPSQSVTANWIHHYLRQPIVLKAAMEHFTGTVGQQRVPEFFIASLEIPVPSIEEQKKVCVILDEKMSSVNQTKKAIEAQIDALNKIPVALLRRAFNGEL